MITLLFVDSLEVAAVAEHTTQAAKALIKGDTSALSPMFSQLSALAVEAGKNILLAVLIYVVGRFVIHLANNFVARLLDRRHVDVGIQSFVKSFVNILLTVLLIVTVVSALGVNTTSFAALLASVGLAFGMALSGNLQNFAGGIIILLLKPFRVGDFIEAQNMSGTVTEVQIFHTIITTADNKRVYLPNGALSSGSITNYSSDIRRVELNFSVEYNTEAEMVKRVLYELINKDERVIKDDDSHAPFVALSALAASSVVFVVRVWVKGNDYWPFYFDMQQTVYTEFNRLGIGFPFPQVTVHQAQ